MQDDIKPVLTNEQLDAMHAAMQNYAACNINVFHFIARNVESEVLRVLADREGRQQDAERYQHLRRKVCIVGGEFHILNLAPTYVAPDAAAELDAVIDAQRAKEDV